MIWFPYSLGEVHHHLSNHATLFADTGSKGKECLRVIDHPESVVLRISPFDTDAEVSHIPPLTESVDSDYWESTQPEELDQDELALWMKTIDGMENCRYPFDRPRWGNKRISVLSLQE